MAFAKKTWKDRLVELAGRRMLKRISGDPNETMVVDVTRSEGTVSQEGDAFSGANMNDLEQRIGDAFEEVNNSLMLRTGRRNSENKYTNKFCIGHCIYGQGLVFEINTETSPRFLTVEILNDNGIWESSWVTGEEIFYGSIYITCNVPSSNVTYGKSYLIRVTTQS